MTTLRLIHGGADDHPRWPATGGRQAGRLTSAGLVHLHDFARAADEVSEWQPRLGELVVLGLYRLGPDAADDRPSIATLHAIAGQVSRTLRRSDVVDVYAPDTIGVLLSGVRDVAAAIETTLQVRGMIDENPLLPIEAGIVVGQGVALAVPGSDATVLMAEAEAALDESSWSDREVLCTRLVLTGVDGLPGAQASTIGLVRVPGAAQDPVWIPLDDAGAAPTHGG